MQLYEQALEAGRRRDYAQAVREAIGKRFARPSLYLVRERVFPDTDEASVVLLAEGWGEPAAQMRVAAVHSIRQFVQVCRDAENAARVAAADSTALRRGALLPQTWLEVYQRTVQRERVHYLGDLARIRIGVVTGANEFFVLRPSSVRDIGIKQHYLRPIVESARQLIV